MYLSSIRADRFIYLLIFMLALSCSKSGTGYTPNPCAGVTIVVNGTVVNTSGPGKADGSITITASGAASLTYSLNGGAVQSATLFSNLSAGTYSVTAKSAEGCSSTGSFTITNVDACAGKTISLDAVITSSDKCAPNGTIQVNVSGSTGFSYRLNASGTYQNDPMFTNIGAGTYTVFAKDGTGCEKSISVTVTSIALGPFFSAVKTLINNKCATCHTSTHSSGIDFTKECTIVTKADNIKVAAVDNETMPKGGPALTASEKKTITDWLAAGGKSSN
jgi:hypothetical protein